MMMESTKTPGTDGLTSEFYRYFWNAISKYMVDSFNSDYNTVHFLSLKSKALFL